MTETTLTVNVGEERLSECSHLTVGKGHVTCALDILPAQRLHNELNRGELGMTLQKVVCSLHSATHRRDHNTLELNLVKVVARKGLLTLLDALLSQLCIVEGWISLAGRAYSLRSYIRS